MGGDTVSVSPLNTSSDDESYLESELQGDSPRSSTFLRMDDLNTNIEEDEVKSSSEFGESVLHPLDVEAKQKRILGVFNEVLRSYDELQDRSGSLEEAKTKILSYTPGAWIEGVGGLELSDYNVPYTSSLLLIGPKRSGKSSLINRISSVFEVDKFAPERAQVSYDISVGAQPEGDGTYFLHEYMIPRGSSSFCLYDTRSLSLDSSKNMETIKRWMTKGVRHGELVIRDSDSSSLRTRMKRKARQNLNCYGEIRMVNFVIFVVDGRAVLKSMDDNNDPRYNEMIASAYDCPFLSFKDDKPVVVITHGDLLSLTDRADVRVHLGQLLGIHPKKQIFDIPESSDPATDMAIVEMLRYSLERADKNLPVKSFSYKLPSFLQDLPELTVSSFDILLCLLMLIVCIAFFVAHFRKPQCAPPPRNSIIDWKTIKYLWLGSEYD